MKYHRILHILVLSTIIPLVAILLTVPAHAAGEDIALSPDEGEIGDKIDIEGDDFDADTIYRIYFSSDKADKGDDIDTEVTAYESTGLKWTNADGEFATTFTVPSELTDGEDSEDVHGGDYYVYVTYHRTTSIVAVARFTVIGGEIEIHPEMGQVGTEVEISGKRFGISQKITIEYDGVGIDIASGDKETDENGKFTCTIVIPESTVDTHTITVTDESGNEPEAEFNVKPKITIDPTSGAVGEVIKVSGTGFEDREQITITVEGYRVSTMPIFIQTNAHGSFAGSFLVPYYAVSDTSKIRASDSSFNSAEAELTILTGISLSPATSQTSPGHVGMELTLYGTGFIASSQITITYDDIKVETASTNSEGTFSATFTAPPSVAGNHIITATDGTNTITSTFTMESDAPPIPVPLLPEVAATVEVETHFEWGNVTDPSGITYTLQIGTDADFTTIVLEKTGLTQSEYTIKREEKLKSTGTDAPYYWRVMAVDGASNEGKWTMPVLFYVDRSQEVTPSWTLYVWIGLGALLLGILGFWGLKRIKR